MAPRGRGVGLNVVVWTTLYFAVPLAVYLGLRDKDYDEAEHHKMLRQKYAHEVATAQKANRRLFGVKDDQGGEGGMRGEMGNDMVDRALYRRRGFGNTRDEN